MTSASIGKVRCAIYTRVSTDQGLDQDFNSLDAQHEAASAYIKSQAHAGWTLIRARYDDGGYSGGSTDRPNLQRLLDDVRARKIDVIVVYKVDRLTRSLADFAKLVELFDAHGVSFVSVTMTSINTRKVSLYERNETWGRYFAFRTNFTGKGSLSQRSLLIPALAERKETINWLILAVASRRNWASHPGGMHVGLTGLPELFFRVPGPGGACKAFSRASVAKEASPS